MTLASFKASLSESAPSADLSAELQALWHDARGDWERAHVIVQDLDSREAAWVHAYLHRKEGDRSNARYWYARAGKPESHASLDEEWASLVTALLDASPDRGR
jgi:hypothetical protein